MSASVASRGDNRSRHADSNMLLSRRCRFKGEKMDDVDAGDEPGQASHSAAWIWTTAVDAHVTVLALRSDWAIGRGSAQKTELQPTPFSVSCFYVQLPLLAISGFGLAEPPTPVSVIGL